MSKLCLGNYGWLLNFKVKWRTRMVYIGVDSNIESTV